MNIALRLCKLTWLENLKGQIIWIACGVGVLILCAVAVLSGAALTHQGRLLDVSTYFFIDATLFLTALFIGAQAFPRDFTNRGLAELLVPTGTLKGVLYLSRLTGHATLLIVLAAFLFLFRHAAFLLAQSTDSAATATTLLMFLLTSLKLTLALCVAAALSVFTRPIISMLGTIALFLFGHFSSGVSGLSGIDAQADRLLSQESALLFKFFRIWNPNSLVLESFQGAWETPSLVELTTRISWGVGAIFVFLAAGILAAQNKEIGSVQAS
jgi:hypothetical protein